MEKPIICTTSTTSLGNTFLNWTILYLSGQDSYVYVDEFLDVYHRDICSDPLINFSHGVGNAHSHKKSNPYGANKTKETIQKIRSAKQPKDLAIIYPEPLLFLQAAKEKFHKNIYDPFFLANTDNHEKLWDSIIEDYSKIFEIVKSESIPLIYVEDNMWNCEYKSRTLDTWDMQGNLYEAQNLKEVYTNSIDWGFPDSEKHFGDNIWDMREYFALHIRPNNKLNFKIDFNLVDYFVEANSLWVDGEHTVEQIMNWLNLNIDKTKHRNWLNVYKKWNRMHLARLRLPQNINFVCNAIINGWNHDLTQYNLNIYDEAYIQHMLIYKHGLTLKNWELDKFPKNTQQLTPLLEEAFYEGLEKIY